MFQLIRSVDWNKYDGYQYYSARKVVSSLDAIVNLSPESGYSDAYNDFLFAVGNNHAGAYYAAVNDGLPILLQIYHLTDAEHVQFCCLNIIIDLYHFGPYAQEAFGSFSMANTEHFVRTTIKDFALLLSPSASTSERCRELMNDLLESVTDDEEE